MGFRLSTISTFYSAVPASILVGSADINGDGINGDLLPGTRRGSLGREVTDVGALNAGIRSYNLALAGTLNPRGQRLPFAVELPDRIRFGDSFISQDIQLSYVLRLMGRMRIEGTAQMFNAFNVSNLVGPAGLPSSPYSGRCHACDASGRILAGESGSAKASAATRLGWANAAAGGTDHYGVRPQRPAPVAADRHWTAARGAVRVACKFLI
jgi:hypothetical protein